MNMECDSVQWRNIKKRFSLERISWHKFKGNSKTFSASENGIASKYNIMMGGIESALKRIVSFGWW